MNNNPLTKQSEETKDITTLINEVFSRRQYPPASEHKDNERGHTNLHENEERFKKRKLADKLS